MKRKRKPPFNPMPGKPVADTTANPAMTQPTTKPMLFRVRTGEPGGVNINPVKGFELGTVEESDQATVFNFVPPDMTEEQKIAAYARVAFLDCGDKLEEAQRRLGFVFLQPDQVYDYDRHIIQQFYERGYADLIESYRKHPSLPEICMFVSDFPEADAFADVYMDDGGRLQGAIVFSSGLFRVLKVVILRIVASGALLDYLGISDGQPNVIYPGPIAQDSDDLPTEEIILQSESRKDIADMMINFAIAFLQYHEFVHIMNGHAALFRNLAPIPLRLSERFLMAATPGNALRQPFTLMERQAIESDADWIATNLIATKILVVVRNVLSGRGRPETRLVFNDVRKTAALAFASVALVFRLFNDESVFYGDPASLSAGHYPPHAFRLFTILSTLMAWVNAHKNLSAAEREGYETFLKNDGGTILGLLERERAILTGIEPATYTELGAKFSAMMDAAPAHASEIKKVWQTLIPRLRPHAYVRLADDPLVGVTDKSGESEGAVETVDSGASSTGAASG